MILRKNVLILLVFALGALFLSLSDKSSEIHQADNHPLTDRARTIITGQASWYSHHSPGIKSHTANNERFDEQALTCAIWGVPFNKMVRVTNLDNGKSVIVRVNDRGPHTRYLQQGRIIDLTKTAFAQIASVQQGLINVKVELL